MKKLILILGLLMAGGTTRAVPQLTIDVVQNEWRADLTFGTTEPVGYWAFYVDESLVGFKSSPLATLPVDLHFDIVPSLGTLGSIGTHEAVMYYEIAGQGAWTDPVFYTIQQPSSPAPTVPDGGATSLLLGLGIIGLAGSRHLANRSSI